MEELENTNKQEKELNFDELTSTLKETIINIEFGVDNKYVRIKEDAVVSIEIPYSFVHIMNMYMNVTLQKLINESEEAGTYISMKALEYLDLIIGKKFDKIKIENDKDFYAYVSALFTSFKVEFRYKAYDKNMTEEISKEKAIELLNMDQYGSTDKTD